MLGFGNVAEEGEKRAGVGDAPYPPNYPKQEGEVILDGVTPDIGAGD